MTEYEKARAWREALGLTQLKLGELLGYSKETIGWMEKGITPPIEGRRSASQRKIKPWVWLRYKLACQGLSHQIVASREWDWKN